MLDSQTLQTIRIYRSYDYSSFTNSVGHAIVYKINDYIMFLFSFQSGYYLIKLNTSLDIIFVSMLNFTFKLNYSFYMYGNSINRFKNGRAYLSYVIHLNFSFIPYATMTTISIPFNDIGTPWIFNTYSNLKLTDVSKISIRLPKVLLPSFFGLIYVLLLLKDQGIAINKLVFKVYGVIILA